MFTPCKHWDWSW